MSYKLSEGALATIMRGGTVEDPVMQILGSKKIAGAGSSERYRLLVSDGCHLNSFAMLATQLNEKLVSGELCDYSIVKINRLITSMVNNGGRGEKRVMIILDLTVLHSGSEVGMKIGNPVTFPDGGPDQGIQKKVASAPSPAPAVSPVKNNGLSRMINQQNRAASNNSMSSPSGSTHTFPISSITPYQNKWTIKARVTNKSSVRTWSNARGEGKLFSMDLVDESGEIRATAFKEQCDKFFDLIEVGRVYFISRCQLKPANKKFSNLKHEYEMTFTNDTEVIPCHDDTPDIPNITFNFISLKQLSDIDLSTIVDVIGVAKNIGDLETFTARTTNKELKKREITLVDQSNTAVSLTLWGQQAEEFVTSECPVIAVKGARMNEFGGGRSVSCLSSSTMQINPDIPEAHRLRGWFDSVGHKEEVMSISARQPGGGGGFTNWVTLKEIRDKQMGSGDKPDYAQVKATITAIRSDNCLYFSCPEENCNKKVLDMNNGMFRCEKCDREYPNHGYRYLMSICLSDWSGQQWASCFQEVSESIIGATAEELGAVWSDKTRVNSIVLKSTFKSYILKLRIKYETFNDELRLKVTVVSVRPVDFKEYCNKLLAEIKSEHGIAH